MIVNNPFDPDSLPQLSENELSLINQRITRNAIALGEKALGKFLGVNRSVSLAEALRSPQARADTRVRRELKKVFEAGKDSGSSGINNSANSIGGVDTSDGGSISGDSGGGGGGGSSTTETLIVIIDGQAVAKEFLIN